MFEKTLVPTPTFQYESWKTVVPLEKLASVVLLIVEIAEVFVLMLEALVEMLEALDGSHACQYFQ